MESSLSLKKKYVGYITLSVWIVLRKDQIILPLQVFPSPEYPDLQVQV